MLNLLASRGLFIGLIAVVIIVVLLCIGLAAMLFFKPFKKGNTLESDVVRRELYRRETELVIRIITEKAEGRKREELIEALRRIKSTETLIDEIIRTEKTERGIPVRSNSAQHPINRPVAQAVTNVKEAPAAAPTEKADVGEDNSNEN